MLFSSGNYYYPKMRKLKKFRRRNKTINFRTSPILNTFAKTTITKARISNSRRYVSLSQESKAVGVVDWVNLRSVNFLADVKSRLISKKHLVKFPLIDRNTLNKSRGKEEVLIGERNIRLQKYSRYGRAELSHRRRTHFRLSHRYKSTTLKKHLHYRAPRLHNTTPTKVFASWVHHVSEHTHGVSFENSIFSTPSTNQTWYLQNIRTNPYVTKGEVLSQLLAALVLWLLYESKQFVGTVHLVNRAYLNDRVVHLHQFFTTHRLTFITPVAVKNQEQLTSRGDVMPYNHFYWRCIISPRIKTLKYSPQTFVHGEQRKLINSTLLMSYRYIPFLCLQSAVRTLRGRGKIGTHQLNRRRSTRPAVSLTSGVAPMFIFPASSVNRHYRPYIGLASGIRLVTNDNFVENCVDNHMLNMSYAKYKSSVLGLLSSLKVDLVASQHGDLVRYLKPTGVRQPVSFAQSLYTRNEVPRQRLISTASAIFSSHRLSRELYNNPILFKYFLWNQDNLSSNIDAIFTKPFLRPYVSDIHQYNFSSRVNLYEQSNLWSSTQLNYIVKRKLVKRLHTTKFVPNVTIWYYETLVKFIEHYTARRVYLKFNPFIENALSFTDLARCSLWEPRVHGFQKILGHRIFVFESLRILSLAIRFRDPAFLSHWMKTMLYRMSFWKYRLLFRYVKFTMRYLFFPYFKDLGFKGLKFVLRGKISVAGNARTRTLVYAIGETSHAKVNNRVLSEFTTINSFTGVMGFLVSFYF